MERRLINKSSFSYIFMPLRRLWGSMCGRLQQRRNHYCEQGARVMVCGVLTAGVKGISCTCFMAAACHELALTWSGLWHTTGRGQACEALHPQPHACRQQGPRASSVSQTCQLLTSSRVRWKVRGRCFVIFHLLVSCNFRERKVEDY